MAVKIVNALMFNLSWFAILLTQSSPIALTVVLLHLIVHLRFIGKGRAELALIAGVTIFGFIFDQVMFQAGVFTMAGEPTMAPIWLTCLWPVFATTLMHAFVSFEGKLVIAVLFGAVGGSLSYVAGVRLTDVDFGSSFWGPVVIGIVWAFAFPLLLKVSSRIGLHGRDDALQAWQPVAPRPLD